MEKYFLIGFLKALGEERFIDALAEYFRSVSNSKSAFNFMSDLGQTLVFPATAVYRNVTYRAASYDAYTREIITHPIEDNGRNPMKFNIEEWGNYSTSNDEIVTCVVTGRVNMLVQKNAQEMKNEAVSNNSSNIYTEDLFQA